MYQPEGIIVAMATPMDADEKINEKELRSQVNRMVDAGVQGLFCLGTNGEFYALDMEEKLDVIKIVVDENRGRLPIIAGTGCITTRATACLSQRAQELGVDAVSIITPYFISISQEELYNHYRNVAESIHIPVIIYNIPARTGVNADYKTVARLSLISNIIGIKDSSGNFDNTLRYIEETGADFTVLAGNDSLILQTLMAGGAGAVSGLANLFPERLVSIYEFWRQGNITEAKKAQESIRPIRDTLKLGNPNSVVKRAMNLLGYQVGSARNPVPGMYKELDGEIEKVLALYR